MQKPLLIDNQNDEASIKLNAASSGAFVEALLNPPGPNEMLRKALLDYRRTVISNDGSVSPAIRDKGLQ